MTFLTRWSEIMNPVATKIYIYLICFDTLFTMQIYYFAFVITILKRLPLTFGTNKSYQSYGIHFYVYLFLPYTHGIQERREGDRGGASAPRTQLKFQSNTDKRSYFPLLTQTINNFPFIVLYMTICSSFSHIKQLLHFSFFQFP